MSSKLFAPKPCKHCPWKRSSRAGGIDIPNFDLKLMIALSSTTFPRGAKDSDKDDFRKLFACHDSKEGGECVCAGYAARDGIHNLNLRLLAVQNRVNLGEIIQRTEQFDLYNDFYEMLDDYVAAAQQANVDTQQSVELTHDQN